jgi:hypothetical protein
LAQTQDWQPERRNPSDGRLNGIPHIRDIQTKAGQLCSIELNLPLRGAINDQPKVN